MASNVFGGLSITFIWYAMTFLIYLIYHSTLKWREENKVVYIFQEEKKKEKKFDTRPPGIEPGLCYRDALNIAGSNCFAYFKM